MPTIPKGPGNDWAVPGKYEVKSVIGSGSYGSVCEAMDKEKDEVVAIKRVKHLFDDPIDCKRVLRECAMLNQMSHPNIVKLHEIVEPANLKTFDEVYIVMEICDSDLKKLVRADVTLDSLHINTVLYTMLCGLKYLHSAGIWHRDLKPANCLVNQDCTVKICDFGLSRAVGAAQVQPLPATPRDDEEQEAASGPVVPSTQRAKRVMTRHVVTRWYRAPELILLQPDYTEQIDVWSVGCIYAELLNMLEAYPEDAKDRGPLFPGTSCYPLSPPRRNRGGMRPKFTSRSSEDQLEVIFDMIGTPTDADISAVKGENPVNHVKGCQQRSGTGLRNRYSWAPPESVKLLEDMLVFNPRTRTTVQALLENPLFAEFRQKDKETVAPKLIVLAFDNEPNLSDVQLRNGFCEEIEKYHKCESKCVIA